MSSDRTMKQEARLAQEFVYSREQLPMCEPDTTQEP
jgi:hypothetical protein